MIEDVVVQEVRRIREAHAARFQYDLAAISADLKESELARDREKFPLIEPGKNQGVPPDLSLQRARFARP